MLSLTREGTASARMRWTCLHGATGLHRAWCNAQHAGFNDLERTRPLQGIGGASARAGVGPLLEAAALTDRGGDALEVGPPSYLL